MAQLLDILAADAQGRHAEAEAAFQALRTAQANHPRLRDAVIRRTLSRCENMDRDEVGDMREQIAEAQRVLAMADDMLSGLGSEINPLAARSLMTEAVGYLAED